MQYGNIEAAVAGLKHGLYSTVRSRIAAENIPLGYPCFSLKGDTETCGLLNNDQAQVDYDADFVTGNVITVNVTSDREGTQTAVVNFDTDQATTLAALRAAVNAMIGINETATVARRLLINSDDGAGITVTTTVTGGAAQAVGTVTASNSGNQVFAGVSMLTQKDPVPYVATDAVNLMIEGWIYIYCATPAVAGEAVSYNANGEFANAGTAVANMTFEGNLSAAGVVLARINQ